MGLLPELLTLGELQQRPQSYSEHTSTFSAHTLLIMQLKKLL